MTTLPTGAASRERLESTTASSVTDPREPPHATLALGGRSPAPSRRETLLRPTRRWQSAISTGGRALAASTLSRTAKLTATQTPRASLTRRLLVRPMSIAASRRAARPTSSSATPPTRLLSLPCASAGWAARARATGHTSALPARARLREASARAARRCQTTAIAAIAVTQHAAIAIVITTATPRAAPTPQLVVRAGGRLKRGQRMSR